MIIRIDKAVKKYLWDNPLYFEDIQQSEIWLIDLDPTKVAEIQKKRPAIVVNDDRLGKLPLKIIVPITDWKDRYDIAPWMVK